MNDDIHDHARPSVQNQNHTPWMMTFADLLSLLLTFFVLLFSMNVVPQGNWNSLVSSFKEGFAGSAPVSVSPSDLPQASGQKTQGLSLPYLENVLLAQVETVPGLEAAQVTRSSGQVVLSLPYDAFFDPAGTTLHTKGRARIKLLATSLGATQNQMLVGVHQPPLQRERERQAQIQKTLRAARNIANAFAENGYRRHIGVLGFGSARFDQLSTTVSQFDKLALANRVDIIFLKSADIKGLDGLFSL